MIKPVLKLPDLPNHHHAGLCGCEPTIGYIRVSKVGDREHLISPDIQLDHIKADAKRKGKRIVKLVFDIDKSGRTFRRRSVDKVIADIKKGLAKSVTVWKWSRWGRNLAYSLAYLGRVEEAGGRVDSATEDVAHDTATGRFNRDMVMRVDQLQSELIGEGWQSVHSHRREEGLPHSGRKHFGYDYISRSQIKDTPAGEVPHPSEEPCIPCRDVKPHFVVNRREAPFLEGLYEAYTEGASIFNLTVRLNAEGFRTATGGEWTPQAVGPMMDTGFAAGLLRGRSSEMRARYGERSIPNILSTYDVWTEGAQAAIIGSQVWDDYKKRRLSQAELPPRSRAVVHALSTLLYCVECSRRLSTRYSGEPRTHQWACTWSGTLHPGKSVSISNDKALAIVKTWVLNNAKPPTTPIDVVAKVLLVKREPTTSRTTSDIEREIERLNTKLGRLLELYTDGMSLERYRAREAELEGEIAELRAESAALESDSPPVSKVDYEVFGSLAGRWDTLTPQQLNAALAKILGYVIVSPAAGRGRWADASDRVDVVGQWEVGSKREWFAARRSSISA